MRNLVIAIGREFGSGGKEIGQKLADRLNIKCYDSELLSIAAKNSGFCEEILKKNDEKPTNSFLYSLMDLLPDCANTGPEGYFPQSAK